MLRLLDLFCGAGGAAMGYSRAGFDVTGIDISPQPRYPFRFVQADALEYLAEHGHEYDVIHASPPCQGYSRLRHLPWLQGREYPMLIEPTRTALQTLGLPWVIENVEDAPMPYSIVLCGTMFDLPVYRHRRFGLSLLVFQPPHLPHVNTIAHGRAVMAKRYRRSQGITGVIIKEINRGSLAGAKETGRLMGIDWMTRAELSQAIPPSYTEWIGRRIIEAMERRGR